MAAYTAEVVPTVVLPSNQWADSHDSEQIPRCVVLKSIPFIIIKCTEAGWLNELFSIFILVEHSLILAVLFEYLKINMFY